MIKGCIGLQHRREIIREVTKLLDWCARHCVWCEAPHSEADLKRNVCPNCGRYLDPFVGEGK